VQIKQMMSGMGEIEKVGDLKYQNLDIRNCSQYMDIEKYCIGFVQNLSI
jgi:hypothetical protein